MATDASTTSTSATAIFTRIIRPDAANLTPEAAQWFLQLRFKQKDLDRMQELVTKNQDDLLTEVEKNEMDNYRRVAYLLDLMHSKARRALKNQEAAG